MDVGESLLQELGQLSLSQKSVPTSKDYVLDLSVQQSSNLVAAASSNFSIHLLSRDSLQAVSTIRGHRNTITKVQFCKNDPHILYSTSRDKTLRSWDTRTAKQIQSFQVPAGVDADLLSLDVGQSGRILCAGTEKMKFDVYLLFWDSRQKSVLGCYSECHDDDITQLSFQPGSDRYLASGSSDKLVCTFDLQETSEDDSLQTTSNAESDVARIGWCGTDSDSVYAVTSVGTFHVWDALEGDSLCTIEDLSSFQESKTVPADYILDCVSDLTAIDDSRSSAVLLAGTYSGDLTMLSLNSAGECTTVCSLSGGHSDIIRCSYWDSKTKSLLTGGEDSLVCLWSVGQSMSSPVTPNKKKQGKVKAKSSISSSGKKPYDRPTR